MKPHQRAIYAWLIARFPASYRARVGESMLDAFEDALRHTPGSALGLYADACVHLLKENLQMISQARTTSLAGPLTFLVGILWILASVGELVLMLGWGSSDSFWDMTWLLFVAVSFLPLLPALLATQARFRQALGSLGRAGIALSVAGSMSLLAFVLVGLLLGWLAPQEEHAWVASAISIFGLSAVLGYALFGLDVLRHKLLPARGNFLPLLVGLATLFRLAPGWAGLPNYHPLQLGSYFLHLSITGVCLACLGALMSSQDGAAPAHGGEAARVA